MTPDTDPDPIRIQGFDDQNLKEKIRMKNFFDQKLQFTYVQAPSYRRGLQPSKENIKHLIYYDTFCGSFLPTWIQISITNPDPGPGTPLNPDPIRMIRIWIHSTYYFRQTNLAREGEWRGRGRRRPGGWAAPPPASSRTGSAPSRTWPGCASQPPRHPPRWAKLRG